jgi:hypothetical protein
MPSVADDLRRDTRARVLAMTVAERIALSLTLGDEDVERYARAAGVPADRARRQLQSGHGAGRPLSRAARLSPDDPAR